jgi:hypothetical protein
MDAIVTVLVAGVGVLGGYIVGNWRLKYENLHERRAEVIAELSKLLAAVQRGVVDLTNPLQPRDVDRREQAEKAQRAFFELVECYRSNEVWLEPNTCQKVEAFMDKVYLPLGDYMDTLDERGYPLGPQGEQGRTLGRQIMREIQPLRRELINEFRAILYPPRWYEAPLRVLERRESSDAAANAPSDQG